MKTATNNSGGIQGGISNGEDIYFNVAFKPPSSISLEQETVNLLESNPSKYPSSRKVMEKLTNKLKTHSNSVCRKAGLPTLTQGSENNSGILSNCRSKWGTDYRMIKYCVDKQTAARRSLGI